MRVNEQVQVRPKDALAPYVGTVIGVGEGTLAVRSADGTVRAHPKAQCDSLEVSNGHVPFEVTMTVEKEPEIVPASATPVDVPVSPAKKARTPRKSRKEPSKKGKR